MLKGSAGRRLNLKIAIVASGKSQRQIAAACGVPENRLSEIVRGWAEPRDREREALAAVLGKPADDLFGHVPVSV
ncbi:MAG TPA: helix-turn-helix transcriptional regulator [Bryobacteraceae bacterium]|nr:helix-turn-helix transcriptional regulator [Bryobacteraceae bacterium]